MDMPSSFFISSSVKSLRREKSHVEYKWRLLMTKVKEKNEWWEWTKAILVALALVWIIKEFLFAPVVVDGESMEPTLHNRDHMVVNKLAYRFGEPKRFDVVVFHAPLKKDFIKRVIGLPGEHIAYKDNQLYVNGKQVKEPFADRLKKKGIWTNDFQLEDLTEGKNKIPEGYLLVLGDNRINSTDSRTIGLVSLDKVVGRTSLIYWPVSRMQILGE